jgi:uncharacterized protein (DUF2141 family)
MMNRSLAVLVVSAALSLAATASAEDTNRITVDVGGLRNAKGVVRCALFDNAGGFPSEPNRALARANAPRIEGGHATCVFENVKPGAYAIGFIHDENSNNQLDKDFIGRPTEGYGASNDARGFMAPPSFEKARFNHAGLTTLRLKTEY